MATAKVLHPLFGVIIAVQRGDCAAAVARERRAGVNLTGGPHSDKGLGLGICALIIRRAL